jgi:hypothetical protein
MSAHSAILLAWSVDSFADCSRRLAIFGAMSSVNKTAHVNDDNTTLNPTLHLDNLDLSLPPLPVIHE